MCRQAIEKYSGKDALQRLAKKEEQNKSGRLASVYSNEVWKNLDEEIQRIVDVLEEERGERADAGGDERESESSLEAPLEVLVNTMQYGRCPSCGTQFDYDDPEDIGKILRCRSCHTSMRLKAA
jgi:hypothetical protein